MFMWLLLVLNLFTEVIGYADGRFPQSCSSMLPLHRNSQGHNFAPQNTEPPFEVVYEHGKEGEPIKVVLQGKYSTTEFLGFMLEARKKDMVDNGPPVGKFILTDQGATRLLTCNGVQGLAVSQTRNTRKKSVQVNWTPEGAGLDVTFRATVAMSYTTFWERVDVSVTLPLYTTSAQPIPTSTSTTEQSVTSAQSVTSSTNTEDQSTTSPTTSAAESSTTSLIPSMVPPKHNITYLLEGVAVADISSALKAVEMGICNLAAIILSNSPFSHCVKVSKISYSVLRAVLEISALTLFSLDDFFNTTLVALMCVAIVMTLTELVIVSLEIKPSHELKEIVDLAVKLCSVINLAFTSAVVTVGAMEIEKRGQSNEGSWLWEVVIAYAVWISLFVIFIGSTHRPDAFENSRRGEKWRRQRQTKLGVVKVIIIAVTVVLTAGALSFAVAVIVGIFHCK